MTATIVGDGSISGPGYVFMGVVNTYTAEHPDVFSGAWIDHDAGGTYVVAFTNDPEPHRAALAARAPSPDDLAVVDPPPQITDSRPLGDWDVPWDVVRVDRTRDDIRETSEAIWNTLEAAGIDIITSGVDIQRSRLSIGLIEPTAAKLIEIADLVDPDLVCVEGPLVDPDRQQPQPGDSLDIIVAGEPPPHTLIDCEGTTIPLSAVLDPQPLDGSGQTELEAGLDDVFRTLPTVPSTGEWFILYNDDETAVLAIPSHGGAASIMTLRRTSVGWTFQSSGGCADRAALPAGLGHVTWRIDPDQPQPSADGTEFDVLVNEEACASGTPMDERLLGPQIVETDTEVLIAFAAITKPGAQDCPGNPETSVTVTLNTPLGTRSIIDGVPTIDIGALLAR